jgi:hypothetical protein
MYLVKLQEDNQHKQQLTEKQEQSVRLLFYSCYFL